MARPDCGPENSQPRGSITPRRRPSRHQSRSCGDSIAVAVLAALALLDPQQHAFGIDIADLERDDLGEMAIAVKGAQTRRRWSKLGECLATQYQVNA